MVIAGIDGSTKSSGIAIFKDGEYQCHTLINLEKMKDSSVRIPQMMCKICKFLDMYDIDKIVIEKSMLKNNIDTVQKLSNLAGAVMYYAASRGLEFEHCYPTEWRKKVGMKQSNKISREVLKQESIDAVKQEYGLDVSDDEAESILIARSAFDLPKIVMDDEI